MDLPTISGDTNGRGSKRSLAHSVCIPDEAKGGTGTCRPPALKTEAYSLECIGIFRGRERSSYQRLIRYNTNVHLGQALALHISAAYTGC